MILDWLYSLDWKFQDSGDLGAVAPARPVVVGQVAEVEASILAAASAAGKAGMERRTAGLASST